MSYDRLSLSQVDFFSPVDSPRGWCVVLSGKGDQVVGLIVKETLEYFEIAYPSKCVRGVSESGEEVIQVIPYTALPLLRVYKSGISITVPVHAESEFHFYSYILDSLSDDRDFEEILKKYGWDPDSCKEYLALRVKESKAIVDESSEEFESANGSTLH